MIKHISDFLSKFIKPRTKLERVAYSAMYNAKAPKWFGYEYEKNYALGLPAIHIKFCRLKYFTDSYIITDPEVSEEHILKVLIAKTKRIQDLYLEQVGNITSTFIDNISKTSHG